jgi:hypothetical protein
MGTSQIIMLVLLSLNLLAGAHLHGKEKTGKHNFWVSATNVILFVTLLISGGFFEL